MMGSKEVTANTTGEVAERGDEEREERAKTMLKGRMHKSNKGGNHLIRVEGGC